jgi:DNA primase
MSNIWQEVKDRLDLENVVSQYISLTPNGDNLKSKCPFHNDKSPSFIVSKSKQIWHCFGCGLGGDAFGFVSLIENISRAEALEKLAKQAGVALDKRQPTNQQKLELSLHRKGQNLLNWSADIYHRLLIHEIKNPATEISKYLLQRGIGMSEITKFKLGYASNQNLFLNLTAKKAEIEPELLFETGLIVQKNAETKIENKNFKSNLHLFKDKFRNRLIIPIFNEKDEVSGFTGRVLITDPNRPKYLNSPQNQWFNKSELLFGLNIAKKNLYQTKELILVEGQMDVIAANKSGINNCVASSGTSITNKQLEKISKLVKTLTLALDNDQAGKLASRKVFLEATKLGMTVNQLIIPSKFKDLDEYLHSEKQQPSLIKVFFLESYFQSSLAELSSDNLQTQKTAIQDCLELVQILDPVSKEQYLQKLSAITGLATNSLKSSLELNHSKSDHLKLDHPRQENLNNKSTVQKLTPQSKLVSPRALFFNNLKIILCIYIYGKEIKPEGYFSPVLIQVLWKLLGVTGVLSEEFNSDLETTLEQKSTELQLIWEEDVHKKLLQRSEYATEQVKLVNNFLLPFRPKLQLDLSLSADLILYDTEISKI